MVDHATRTVATGAAGVSPAHGAGQPQHLEHNSGRGISWIGVTIAIIGSVIGGVAFVPHLTWWLFWVGTAVTVLGILVLAVARTVSKDWY